MTKLSLLTRTITIKSTDGEDYLFQTFSSVKIDESEIFVEFCGGGVFTYLRAEHVEDKKYELLWKIEYIC